MILSFRMEALIYYFWALGRIMMKPKIRKRRIDDSEELAHAIAIVWNTTYKGIVDDEFLMGLLKSEKQSS